MLKNLFTLTWLGHLNNLTAPFQEASFQEVNDRKIALGMWVSLVFKIIFSHSCSIALRTAMSLSWSGHHFGPDQRYLLSRHTFVTQWTLMALFSLHGTSSTTRLDSSHLFWLPIREKLVICVTSIEVPSEWSWGAIPKGERESSPFTTSSLRTPVACHCYIFYNFQILFHP